MKRRARLLALGLLLSLLATGCASTRRAADDLQYVSMELSNSLKFGDYGALADLLPAERRNLFLARAYGIEGALSILEMTTLSTTMAPDGERAQSLIRMSWYELPSTIVKTDNVFVDWTRIKAGTGKAWQIERITGGPLPVPEEE